MGREYIGKMSNERIQITGKVLTFLGGAVFIFCIFLDFFATDAIPASVQTVLILVGFIAFPMGLIMWLGRYLQ